MPQRHAWNASYINSVLLMTFIVTEVIRSLRSVMRSRLRFELLHFRGCLFHFIAAEMPRKRLVRKPAVQTSARSGPVVLGQVSRPDRNFRLGERSDCYREEAREPDERVAETDESIASRSGGLKEAVARQRPTEKSRRSSGSRPRYRWPETATCPPASRRAAKLPTRPSTPS